MGISLGPGQPVPDDPGKIIDGFVLSFHKQNNPKTFWIFVSAPGHDIGYFWFEFNPQITVNGQSYTDVYDVMRHSLDIWGPGCKIRLIMPEANKPVIEADFYFAETV